MTPLLISIANVTVERDGTTILHDFNWQVQPGENWVVFGPNGAGKTSVLNVLQGYLWPTRGRVQVVGGTLGDGVDVREMRKNIPVVSESVRRMIHDYLTGHEVIVTGARAHLDIFDPVTEEESREALAMAARTGIESLLKKTFGVMSTGERQRVLIARALMARPSVVVLDEPCTGLDLAGREWVLSVLEDFQRDAGAPSLLLTTHHVEEIGPSFTHALLLKNGGVFAAGAMEEVFTGENLSNLFDMPLDVRRADGRWTARAKN